MSNKLHSNYPRKFRAEYLVGTMTYRGETITSRFVLEDRGYPGCTATWIKWYRHKGLYTPSLVSLLNSIDYTQAGVRQETEKLVALPAGIHIVVNRLRYIKTDCQHDHEAPGNWFVNLLTGKLVHAGDLAARLCGYQPRKNNLKNNLTTTSASPIVTTT